MIYGQLQYFNDELKFWFQIIQFHKKEVEQLLIHFNILLSFPVVSLHEAKTANSFMDQLMVQDQRFDHIRYLLDHQSQQLKNWIIVSDELEPEVVARQESCRSKMKTYELAFIKSKYVAAFFLAAFFQPQPVVDAAE